MQGMLPVVLISDSVGFDLATTNVLRGFYLTHNSRPVLSSGTASILVTYFIDMSDQLLPKA